MRATVLMLTLLFAAAADAQQAASAAASRKAAAAQPDYSRDTLMRLFVEPPPAAVDSGIRYGVGTVEFNGLGTHWRFNYLPLMMPLSGSMFTVTQQLPDPFALTGTSLAIPPRLIRQQQRAVARELKRIGKMKVEVKVKRE